MPIPAEQSFSVSPGSSLAWGSAEPSPVTLPGSMDMGYGWRPYGSESAPSDQISPFGPGSSTASSWMAATPSTVPPGDWHWNNGLPPTTQARSMSFSGESMRQHQQQFVPVPSNAPYNRGGPKMGGMFTSPLSQPPGPGHQLSQSSGSWQPTPQPTLQQQQPRQQNMDYEAWSISHGNGPSM